MPGPTVLVVEDNPITMKMIRLALRSGGYSVLEAEDGATALELAGRDPAPDLILQDLKLPDMDGVDLVRRLRGLPGGDAVPILALSGFLSRMQSARMVGGGFTDYLFKPIEPSQLLSVVGAYARPASEERPAPGAGRRVLVVDDDPVQRKLTRTYLVQAGYDVTTAADGQQALEKAQTLSPHAVVSDVLMPRLDGFRLCAALKRDERLGSTPVILTSSAFTEGADVELARRAGADALVARSPDQQELMKALQASLSRGSSPQPNPPVAIPAEQYARRVAVQLERQASLVARLTSRLAKRQVEIGILSTASAAIKESEPMERVLQETLQLCLNACGFSRGAIHLVEAGGDLAVGAQFGLAGQAEGLLPGFFGHAEVLRKAMEIGRPLSVPGPWVDPPAAERILAGAGVASIVLHVISLGEERQGVFWMGSDRLVPTADAAPFSRAIAVQLAQAVSLCRAFERVRNAEKEYHEIFESAAEGIVRIGSGGELLQANPAMARILGYDTAGDLLRAAPRLPDLLLEAGHREELERSLRERRSLDRLEARARRADGSSLWISLSARAVRTSGGQAGHLGFIEGVVQSVAAAPRPGDPGDARSRIGGCAESAHGR